MPGRSQRRREIVRCSFCDKSQEQVLALIGGPGDILICDECVALCAQIIQGAARHRAEGGTIDAADRTEPGDKEAFDQA